MDPVPINMNKEHPVEGQLGATWCLWEKYQSTQFQTRENYAESLQIIYEFSTLEEFAMIWKLTPYGHPSNLFFDVERQMSKKFQSKPNQDDSVTESLFLFRKGVNPEWEDPHNKNGTSLIMEFKNYGSKIIDGIWQSVVFAMVGSTFPHSERIMGFRALDRLKKHDSFKVEIWTSVPDVNPNKSQEENKQNETILNEIIAHFHKLLSETVTISVHSIIVNDHSRANKL